MFWHPKIIVVNITQGDVGRWWQYTVDKILFRPDMKAKFGKTIDQVFYVVTRHSRLTSSIRDNSFRVQVSQEERVDKSRLAKSTLADDHERKLESFLHRLAMDLIG